MDISLPIMYDIQNLYEKEYEIGKYGLKLIKEQLKILLPKSEAAFIALHLINAQEQEKNKEISHEQLLDNIVKMIETEFGIEVNKDNFNYARFITHIEYLLKRGLSNHLIETANEEMYLRLVESYPKTSSCVDKISSYLKKAIHLNLSDEEKLYLILHINRLCTRQDCNQ